MRKINKFMTVLIITILTTILFVSSVNAAINVNLNLNKESIKELNKDEVMEIVKNNIPEDTDNVKAEDVLNIYDEITSKYSNDEIANLLEQNKAEIMENIGINEDTIEAGANFLRNTDQEAIKDILNNNLNIKEIQEKIDQGQKIEEAILNTLSLKDIFTAGILVLLANAVFKRIIMWVIAFSIYNIIITWIIYHKAHRHGWAVLIPIYREITYFKVCKMSPWWILLWMFPIFGWFAYKIVKIVSRFKLAEAFGRGAGFGVGLWLLSPIFNLILAVSDNKYVDIENKGEDKVENIKE